MALREPFVSQIIEMIFAGERHIGDLLEMHQTDA